MLSYCLDASVVSLLPLLVCCCHCVVLVLLVQYKGQENQVQLRTRMLLAKRQEADALRKENFKLASQISTLQDQLKAIREAFAAHTNKVPSHRFAAIILPLVHFFDIHFIFTSSQIPEAATLSSASAASPAAHEELPQASSSRPLSPRRDDALNEEEQQHQPQGNGNGFISSASSSSSLSLSSSSPSAFLPALSASSSSVVSLLSLVDRKNSHSGQGQSVNEINVSALQERIKALEEEIVNSQQRIQQAVVEKEQAQTLVQVRYLVHDLALLFHRLFLFSFVVPSLLVLSLAFVSIYSSSCLSFRKCVHHYHQRPPPSSSFCSTMNR